MGRRRQGARRRHAAQASAILEAASRLRPAGMPCFSIPENHQYCYSHEAEHAWTMLPTMHITNIEAVYASSLDENYW